MVFCLIFAIYYTPTLQKCRNLKKKNYVQYCIKYFALTPKVHFSIANADKRLNNNKSKREELYT